MGKTIFDREYHLRRLVRRNLRNHVNPFFGLSASRLRHENEPRLVRVFANSPRFGTRQEAAAWAKAHPRGTHWGVGKSHATVRACLWDLEGGLGEARTGGRDPGVYYYGILYERVGAPFRQPSVGWDLEERLRREEEREMRQRLSEGAFKGNVKPYRRQFHKQRRAAGKRAEHLALRGLTDEAEDVNLHVGQRGIMSYVW